MAYLPAAVDALEKALRGYPDFRAWLRSRRWCGEALAPELQFAVEDRAVLAESADEVVLFVLAVARDAHGGRRRPSLRRGAPRRPPIVRGAAGGLVEPRRPDRDDGARGRVQVVQAARRAQPGAGDPPAAAREGIPARPAPP